MGSPRLDVNISEKNGITALCTACINGHEVVVSMLLVHKDLQVNKADDNMATPLTIACAEGHLGLRSGEEKGVAERLGGRRPLLRVPQHQVTHQLARLRAGVRDQRGEGCRRKLRETEIHRGRQAAARKGRPPAGSRRRQNAMDRQAAEARRREREEGEAAAREAAAAAAAAGGAASAAARRVVARSLSYWRRSAAAIRRTGLRYCFTACSEPRSARARPTFTASGTTEATPESACCSATTGSSSASGPGYEA